MYRESDSVNVVSLKNRVLGTEIKDMSESDTNLNRNLLTRSRTLDSLILSEQVCECVAIETTIKIVVLI